MGILVAFCSIPCQIWTKKSPLGSGLKSIFLEENRGDRAEYGLRIAICLIYISNNQHVFGECLQNALHFSGAAIRQLGAKIGCF
jgi:hypothetical protein